MASWPSLRPPSPPAVPAFFLAIYLFILFFNRGLDLQVHGIQFMYGKFVHSWQLCFHRYVGWSCPCSNPIFFKIFLVLCSLWWQRRPTREHRDESGRGCTGPELGRRRRHDVFLQQRQQYVVRHAICDRIGHSLLHALSNRLLHAISNRLLHPVPYPVVHQLGHRVVYAIRHRVLYAIRHRVLYPFGHRVLYRFGHGILHRFGHQLGHCFVHQLGHSIIYAICDRVVY